MTERHDHHDDTAPDESTEPCPAHEDGTADAPRTGDSGPAPDPADPVSRRSALTIGGVGLAAVLGTGALALPLPRSLGEITGDEALAEAVRDHLDGHSRVAVTLIDTDGSIRFAGFGVEETTEFEIGSVSKGFTGNLLALGIEKDGLRLDTTVEEVLGERANGSAIADVTLQELATHTAGLPPATPSAALGGTWRHMLRKDPHGFQDVDDVIEGALGLEPSDRGEPAYSNLGVGLLGQLLALAAGTDYVSLLRERILDPLDMGSTYVPVTPEGLRDSAVRGHTRQGHRSGHWTLGGVAPAGGIRSTPADMTVFLTGMIDGSAPGASAATEVLFEEPDENRAMCWIQLLRDDQPTIHWHNGMTGGFASFCGWIPETGRGVMLMSATALSLDELAIGLLTEEVSA